MLNFFVNILSFAIYFGIGFWLYFVLEKHPRALFIVAIVLLVIGLGIFPFGLRQAADGGNYGLAILSLFLIVPAYFAMAIWFVTRYKKQISVVVFVVLAGFALALLLWTLSAREAPYEYDGARRAYLEFADEKLLRSKCLFVPDGFRCTQIASYKPELAESVHKRSCNAGDALACESYAIELYDNGEYESALQSVEGACEGARYNANNCMLKAQIMESYAEGGFSEKDIRDTYKLICSQFEGESGSTGIAQKAACNKVITYTIEDIENGEPNAISVVEPILKGAVDALSAGSDGAPLLVNYAILLHDYSGNIDAVNNAQGLLETHCLSQEKFYKSEETGLICTNLGKFYEFSVPEGRQTFPNQPVVDLSKAFAAYERACAFDPNFCTSLANMYKDGLGVEKDAQTAMEFFAQSCSNDIEACNAMVEIVNENDGGFFDLRDCEPYYIENYCVGRTTEDNAICNGAYWGGASFDYDQDEYCNQGFKDAGRERVYELYSQFTGG